MAKKKVPAVVKIQIPAGQASPAPPVGTALGPHGVAIMDFCKEYNARTESQRGTIVPVEISVYEDRIVLVRHQDPAGAGADPSGGRARQGLADPGQGRRVGQITDSRSPRSPQTKLPDLNTDDIDAAKLQIAGTARSMGIRVADRPDLTCVPSEPSPAGRTSPRGTTRRGSHHGEGQEVQRRRERFDREQLHAPDEAVELVKSLATGNFDETVELAVRLGVDPRKADQMVRGTVALPSGTGKDVRVAVFAIGDAAREAEAAGADVVGADDLAAEHRGWLPRLRHHHRHPRHDADGRQAGPRARPPWPDAEPQDGHRDHRRRQGRRASSRAARSSTAPTATATSTCPLGKVSFPVEALEANFNAVVDELNGPSRPRRRAATSGRSPSRRRWAPASRSTPTGCSPSTTPPPPERSDFRARLTDTSVGQTCRVRLVGES